MAMPAMPLASRSSTIRFCSAAVPSAGILNSTSTAGSSLSACSTPLRAMDQKSDALLVTKASLVFFSPVPFEHAKISRPVNPNNTQESTNLRNFITALLIFILVLNSAVKDTAERLGPQSNNTLAPEEPNVYRPSYKPHYS